MADRLDVEDYDLSRIIWLYGPDREASLKASRTLKRDEDWFIVDHYIAIMEPIEAGSVVQVMLNIVKNTRDMTQDGRVTISPSFDFTVNEAKPFGLRIDFHDDMADWEFGELLRRRYPKP